ncbi:MAG TPA: flavodoxin domain-containing protein [Flavitalea sp.]|nr:flavodoxin domain-containing protein [Flavitalea sp.]
MKGLIVYSSKYGATRQYAQWIAEELEITVLTSDAATAEDLVKYDFLVVGSSVYMGKLLITEWLKKNISRLQNKKLFLFVVCGTPSSEKEKQQRILDENVPALLRQMSHTFFLPGRLIKKELSWTDRLLVKIGAKMEKDPIRKKAMLEDIDAVKSENLDELIKAIQSFFSKQVVA